jgi:16S rRNA (cytosine967-C5)-methyltransferase
VAENRARLGTTILTPVQADAGEAQPPDHPLSRPFDRILVDAPCSGLGVLRRHPEGKWQKEETALRRHADLQSRLLARAAVCLRPGGVLLYSTCSTEPDENEQVVDRFCRAHPAFTRESVAPWLPSSGRHLLTSDGAFSTVLAERSDSLDGFYAVRLRKGT